MRIALFLTGQFRNIVETYPYIKGRILERFNPDVFISTWDPSDNIRDSLQADTRHLNDSLSHEEILSLFKPKRFLSENFDSKEIQDKVLRANLYIEKSPMAEILPNGKRNGEINPVSVFSMWYKIKNCLDLMLAYEIETGEKYDLIIKGRFDLKFHNNIPMPTYSEEILIPPGYDWRGGINDVFAFGAREAMIYYCSMFDYLENYIANENVFFHPETLLKHHLTSSNYRVSRPDIKVSLRGSKVWEKEVTK